MDTIEKAIEDIREGKFVIVVDDEDRENEGDFIIAAEKITPEKVNFMLQHGRGVLCFDRGRTTNAEVILSDSVQLLIGLRLIRTWVIHHLTDQRIGRYLQDLLEPSP